MGSRSGNCIGVRRQSIRAYGDQARATDVICTIHITVFMNVLYLCNDIQMYLTHLGGEVIAHFQVHALAFPSALPLHVKKVMGSLLCAVKKMYIVACVHFDI